MAYDAGSSITVTRVIRLDEAFKTPRLHDPDTVKITITLSGGADKITSQDMINDSEGRYSYVVQTEAGWDIGQYTAKIVTTDAVYGNDIDIQDEFILE